MWHGVDSVTRFAITLRRSIPLASKSVFGH
jgi:hypothetical protein